MEKFLAEAAVHIMNISFGQSHNIRIIYMYIRTVRVINAVCDDHYLARFPFHTDDVQQMSDQCHGTQ